MKNMEKKYDIVVVGGGPAGITSAIYAKRANKSVVIIEKFMPGGQVGLIGNIENYTGFPSIDGASLSAKFFEHASSLGVEFAFEEAEEFDLSGKEKVVKCNKNTYTGKAVVLAQGSHSRLLGIDGEKEFTGKGVSYCALCDGNFFKGKTVAVVGSGDSAFSDADYLSNLCKRVYILTKDNLKLHNYAENEFDGKENVEILKGALSQKIEGSDKVESLSYTMGDEEKELQVDAVFVAIGRTPDTANLVGKIDMDGRGFIHTDQKMKTSADGVYACGDVRADSIKQIATAVGDGAIAGTEAVKYAILVDKGLVK